MSGPVIVRPWQFRLNAKVLGSPTAGVFPPQYVVLTLAQNTMFYVKQSLLGVGADWVNLLGASVVPTGNWSVSFSCDSVTAGAPGDGVDRWTTAAKLVPGSGAAARAWIVLRQPGVAANYEVCIELNNSSNPQQGTIVVSPNSRFGFGGGGAGSTTARPTADDEIVLVTTADWGSSSIGTDSNTVHVLKSADGAGTRLLICRDGYLATIWCFEQPSKPLASWQHPSVSLIVASSASRVSSPVPNLTTLNNAAAAKSRSLDFPAGVAYGSFLTVSGGGAAVGIDPSAQLQPNDQDGTTPFFSIDLFTTTPYGARGRSGIWCDLWFVPQNYSDSSTIPADDSRQFIQAGVLATPWPGVVPLWF